MILRKCIYKFIFHVSYVNVSIISKGIPYPALSAMGKNQPHIVILIYIPKSMFGIWKICQISGEYIRFSYAATVLCYEIKSSCLKIDFKGGCLRNGCLPCNIFQVLQITELLEGIW